MDHIPQKRMPTVMRQGDIFARVPPLQADRSVFDRSHAYKTTFDAGLLVPIFCEYAMPGDTFDVRLTAIARLATPIKPFMDNMYFDTFFFAVPLRLIWANSKKFFGEQTNPGDSIAFTVPQYNGMPATGFVIGTLYDYLGLPTAGTPGPTVSISFSALPLRADALIYNEFFRDENLINSVTVPTGDGPDTTAQFAAALTPRKRGKRFDYFTSCLPSPQKGVAASFPVSGTQATVKTNTTDLFTGTQQGLHLLKAASGGSPVSNIAVSTGTGGQMRESTLGATAGSDLLYPSNLYADLTGAGLTALVSDLRLAVATQQFLERDMRGGTRYIELIFSQFGVESSDARLQRPEYLGGGSTPIIVAPVAQQTQTGLTGGTTPIGNLSGVGAVMVSGHGFTKSFEEHCVVLGYANVRADLTYSQGLERFWSYSSRLDFPWPIFAHLGEQAVLNKEIFATGVAADNNTFGYQERYAERRYKPSKVTGLMRPAAATNLSVWNLSELFGSLPVLGQPFIEEQITTVLATRVAVPSEPDFILDAWYDFKMAAILPVFGVPGLKRF